MIKIFRQAPIYFLLLAIFLIIGALVLLQIERGDAILYFAQHRTTLANYLFVYGTKLGEEHIYILLVSIFAFVRFRYAILSVLSGLSALLSAWLLKVYFAHPRPFVHFSQLDKLDTVNPIEGVYLYSGMTSFPSGHTMSAFATFTLVALLFSKRSALTVLCFLLALLVGISRVYLVQHFFEDVYLGTILGTLVGMMIYRIQLFVPLNEQKWIDRSFLHSGRSLSENA